jgi:nitrogen fixation protein NifQ
VASVDIASPLPILTGDADLIQRVVQYVVGSQGAGALPRLSWHAGLSVSERRAVRTRWPQSSALWDDLGWRASTGGTPSDPPDLLRPLRDLLVTHRAIDDPALTVLSNALSCACFGAHHLWRDLGLSGRDDVSRLMKRGFPMLHDGNYRDLRWKRYLFLKVGERLGRQDMRPPNCESCDGHAACFGSAAPTSAGAPSLIF